MNKKLENMKLSAKIAGLTGIFLVAAFTVFIITAVIFTQSAIEDATFGELSAATGKTGSEVQSIINEAVVSAAGSGEYMQTVYEKRAQGKNSEQAGQNREEASNASEVFPEIILTADNKDVEQFILQTAINAVASNKDIMGVGALFEPYKFTDKKESYSFYITEDGSGETELSDFGGYEDYSNKDFYANTIMNQSLTITEPPVLLQRLRI